jgi:hydrogenase maturation protease
LENNDILIYGFGNPGRQDDGLGPALIDKLESEKNFKADTDSNYQLNIEDAYEISRYNTVIFVDASLNCKEAFCFYEIEPADEITFTTHAMSPQSILALCEDLYPERTKAYILEIKGEKWDFVEGLSPEAEENLEKAYDFIKKQVNHFLLNDVVSI